MYLAAFPQNILYPHGYQTPRWHDATGDHYLPYSEVRGQETTGKDRPTFKLLKEKKKKPIPLDSSENTIVNAANQSERKKSADGKECPTSQVGILI
jgi:hypothetical protein